MKLTVFERFALANQCRIIETLCPNDAPAYRDLREALEKGFELHWNALPGIVNDRAPLSQEECNEVIGIFAMHAALIRSFNALESKEGINPEDVEFWGWSGRDEMPLVAYTQWLFERFLPSDAYPAPTRNCDRNGCENFSGISPMLERYRSMRKAWDSIGNRPDLKREDILMLLAARDEGTAQPEGVSANQA